MTVPRTDAETPVADPEPAASPATPVGQEPPPEGTTETEGQPPEPESGPPSLATLVEGLDDANVVLELPVVKDALARKEQSGRQKAFNEEALWGQQRETEKGQRDDLDRTDATLGTTLAAETIDGPTARTQVSRLRELAVEVERGSVREQLRRSLARHPAIDDLTEGERAEMVRIPDRQLERWHAENIAILDAASRRQAKEVLRPEVRREVEAEYKLKLDIIQQQQAGAERGESPPRVAPGGATASGTDDTRLLDPKTPIEEVMEIRARQKGRV